MLDWLQRLRRGPWLWASLAAFVVQNHCGVPGIQHDQLAVHFLDRGQFERALREARRAVREARDDAHPRLILALAHAGLGDDAAAVRALREALRLDPDDPRLYAALRTLCADAGRQDLALRILVDLAVERPDHWLLQLNLGWAHRAVGDEERARQLLEAAVASADSTTPVAERLVAHLELSRLYLALERLADAASVLDAAVDLQPADPRVLVSAGEAHLRLDDDELAASLFERALTAAAAADVSATATAIAIVYYQDGDRLRAIAFYERAVDAGPTPLLLNNLAWTYAEADLELERAQTLSLRAVKADADNVVYLDTYAEILYRRGQHARAVALMQRCLALEPADGEHYAYLQGQLARFTGNAAAAAPP